MKQPPFTPAWLAACPERLRAALAACDTDGDWRPDIALLGILQASRSEEEPARLLREAQAAATSPEVARRLGELRSTLSETPDAWRIVSAALASVHGPAPGSARAGERSTGLAQSVADWASRFDTAAAHWPEASVALYSFGDRLRLARASEELVQRAQAWGFLHSDGVYLDLGCGIGRLEPALARHVRFVIGVDISPRMLELARQRCSALSNVAFQLVNGRDLEGFASGSLQGVLAIDSFPYLVECGAQLTEQLLDEIRRVLKPGGQLLILNFSYRGDLAADRADVAGWAERAGMLLLRDGVRELHTWDGVAFQLLAPA